MPQSHSKPGVLSFAEGTIYLVLLCLLGYPLTQTLWLSQGFLSLDGPAHIYNALLIKHLLVGDPHANALYALNPFPVPNLLGHALLVALTRFFSPVEAEKVVVLLSMALIPIGAFALGSTIDPKKGTLAALLTASMAFCSFTFLGFYNYLLSVGVALFAMGLFVRLWPKNGPWPYVAMNLLGLLVYSAHLFSLALLGLFMGVWALIFLVNDHRFSLDRLLKIGLKVAGMLALPMVLALVFLLMGKKGGDVAVLSPSARWGSLWEGQLFHGLIPEQEKPWGQLLTLLLGAAACLSLLSLFRRNKSANQPMPIVVTVVGLGVFLLMLYAPTGLAAGGYVVERFQYMALIFMALLAAFSLKGVAARLLLSFTVTYVGIQANEVRLHYLKSHFEHYHAQAAHLASLIDPFGTVVSVSLSDNWFEGHFINLVAAYSPYVVMTDNYEADQGYFPVIWKGGKSPFGQSGSAIERALSAAEQCKTISGAWPSNILIWRGDLLSPTDREALAQALPNYTIQSPNEGYYLLFGLKP